MDVNYSFNPYEVKEIIKIKEQNKGTHTQRNYYWISVDSFGKDIES